DGVATMLSGAGGGVGTTTYAENIGVMASSRIYSTAAYWVAGVVAMCLAFFPKFGALIATIPMGVAAGAGIILYGMIGIMGARIWVNNAVDFSNTINLMAAGSGLIIAIADPVVEVAGMQPGGIALGTLAALGIYHLLTAIARWRDTEPSEQEDYEAVEPCRVGHSMAARPRASPLGDPDEVLNQVRGGGSAPRQPRFPTRMQRSWQDDDVLLPKHARHRSGQHGVPGAGCSQLNGHPLPRPNLFGCVQRISHRFRRMVLRIPERFTGYVVGTDLAVILGPGGQEVVFRHHNHRPFFIDAHQ